MGNSYLVLLIKYCILYKSKLFYWQNSLIKRLRREFFSKIYLIYREIGVVYVHIRKLFPKQSIREDVVFTI